MTAAAGTAPAGLDGRLDAALTALEWPGVVLPRHQMSGGAVYPVIAWTPAARWRLNRGLLAVTCRATVAEWEYGAQAGSQVEALPPAVRVVGFLHAGRPADGVDRLKAVAAYGAGAIVVDESARMGRWTLAEADVAGVWVVTLGGVGNARVVLRGRSTALPSARRSAATRLREEQLFDWAVRHGFAPTGDEPSAADDGWPTVTA